MSAEFEYWAFISYSHRDKVWGDWLHHALETYRVPKPLVGRATTRGNPVPARAFPVFRDREELPTADDLGYMLRSALEKSRYLIVICSPRAAASRWVNEEILAYKRLGRENRILAIIVDGSPNATDTPGKDPTLECYPRALRFAIGPDGHLTDERTHSIAADARPNGDGKANALLKLLAGVLGVGYDELKQRNEEYLRTRRRRLQMAAAALAGLLAFASVATQLAWRGQRQLGDNLRSEWQGQAQAIPLLANGRALFRTESGPRHQADDLRYSAEAAQRQLEGVTTSANETLAQQRKMLAHLQDEHQKVDSDTEILTHTLFDLELTARQFTPEYLHQLQTFVAGQATSAQLALSAALRDSEALAASGKVPLPADLRAEVAAAGKSLAAAVHVAKKVIATLDNQLTSLATTEQQLSQLRTQLRAIETAVRNLTTAMAGNDQAAVGRASEQAAAFTAWTVTNARLTSVLEDWAQACGHWQDAEKAWKDYLARFAYRVSSRSLLVAMIQGGAKTGNADGAVMPADGSMNFPGGSSGMSAGPSGTSAGPPASVGPGGGPIWSEPEDPTIIRLRHCTNDAENAARALLEQTEPATAWLRRKADTEQSLAVVQVAAPNLLAAVAVAAKESDEARQLADKQFAAMLARLHETINSGDTLCANTTDACAKLNRTAFELVALTQTLPPPGTMTGEFKSTAPERGNLPSAP